MNFKDDLIEYKCLCCNKNYQHKFDEKLKEQFFNTYKFVLLLRRGVYLYEYKNVWKNSMIHNYLKKKIFTVT